MEEKDMVQLLRFYRHDLMNQLQLIQGYLSMDKPEMVKEKVAAYTAYLQKEQKLMNMNASAFTLWLLFFNDTHSNFRLTYDINVENIDLREVDNLLTKQCKYLFDYLKEHLPEAEYYEGHFVMELDDLSTAIKGNIVLDGDFREIQFGLIKQLQGISQLQIEKTKKGMQCVFLLPFHNEVE